MGRLSLSLLGGFQARCVPPGRALGLPRRKNRALLAYLATPPGRPHTRDSLIGLLWGELPAERARNNFRQALFALRATFDAVKLRGLNVEEDIITLDSATVEVDVVTFERLLADGTPSALKTAARLYTGDFLHGLDVDEPAFEEWLMGQRERLRGAALGALDRLLAHQVKQGGDEAALDSALRLLALDPLQEAVHRTVMVLHTRHGRYGSALRQYETCLAALQAELGVEPEEETRALYRRLLRGQISRPAQGKMAAADRGWRSEKASGLRQTSVADTPLVGRTTEMDRLRSALTAARQHCGRVVAVLGEAGIGKTRLVTELIAEAARQGTRVVIGRSYESERVVTFGPWLDAMRASQISSDGDLLGYLGPSRKVELARFFPELGPPPRYGGQDGHGRFFEAVASLVGHLATRRPLVVLLEDVHSADPMSARLLAFLGRRIQRMALLLVATAREEEIDSDSALGLALGELREESGFVQITLTPLDQGDTARLVGMLVAREHRQPELAVLASRVWDASAGNPFMVVETVRALREASVPQSPDALPLPRRVREVIATRLGRLSEPARQIVAVATVIGRAFDFEVVQRASGLDGPATAGAIEELVRRRILRGAGDELDFAHDHIRDVADQRLHSVRRRLLHGEVAAALEACRGADREPHYGVLARHFQEAGVWDRALVYLRKAGEAAAARGRNREAVSHFEQALDALNHCPRTRASTEQAVDLRIALRAALHPLGELERAVASLREGADLARKLDDPRRLAWVSVCLAGTFWVVDRVPEALAISREALDVGEGLGDTALQAAAGVILGGLRNWVGHYLDATHVLRKALTLLDGDLGRERLGLTGYPAVLGRVWLVEALGELGEFDDAIAVGQEGIRLAEALEHPYSLMQVCTALGEVHGIRGDFSDAIRFLGRALTLCREWDMTGWLSLSMAYLGYVHVVSGQVDEGLALVRQALDATADGQMKASRRHILRYLAEAHRAAGRVEDARSFVEQALSRAREHRERSSEAWALRVLGDVAMQRAPLDVDEAESRYQEALMLGRELSMRPVVAHCELGLGTLYRRCGRLEHGKERLTAAAHSFREMGMTVWLARADAELAALTDIPRASQTSAPS